MTSRLRTTLLVVLAAVSAAACSTTRAAVPLERPALDVPPPPPRVIVPLPPPELPEVQPVGELPAAPGTAPPARPRPPQQREKPEPAKPEPKPETPPTEPVTPPVPQLRTPESASSGQPAQQVRETIDRTRAILDKVVVGKLNPQWKKAYEDAVLFAQQADDALKISNLVFARELADKAERLARELQGR